MDENNGITDGKQIDASELYASNNYIHIGRTVELFMQLGIIIQREYHPRKMHLIVKYTPKRRKSIFITSSLILHLH